MFVKATNSKIFIPQNEAYGVQWNINDSSPVLTRIGDPTLHVLLPVQSQMKRVLLSNAGVETLLSDTDSTRLASGGAATLGGSAGQIMVRIPEFYYRAEEDGDIRRLWISKNSQEGFRQFRKAYMSIDCTTVHRPTNTLSSVVSTSADYRGGNNNAAWDADPEKSLLGKPATNISRDNFRTYARNRGNGWEMLPYHVYNAARMLYFVEYANFNSQIAYNPALTAEGYRQGGLGVGVTAVNSTNWNTWNSYNPFVPINHTLSLGNATGVKNLTLSTFNGGSITVSVPSYRGIANFFGHIWQNTDGCLLNIEADGNGGRSEFYMTEDPDNFSDSDFSTMLEIGSLSRSSGFIKDVLLGDKAAFMPKEVGAGSTTYYSDYFYTSIPSSGASLQTLLLGGDANAGATAGFSIAYSGLSPEIAAASLGSRLCFLI